MNVVITGTSRGIGKAIAQRFLDGGHTVAGIDILPSSIDNDRYTHYIGDIIRGELPEITDTEILVNNAGVQDSGEDIDVNLKGSIRVTEKYGIQEKIRSILFIASASASTGSDFP